MKEFILNMFAREAVDFRLSESAEDVFEEKYSNFLIMYFRDGITFKNGSIVKTFNTKRLFFSSPKLTKNVVNQEILLFFEKNPEFKTTINEDLLFRKLPHYMRKEELIFRDISYLSLQDIYSDDLDTIFNPILNYMDILNIRFGIFTETIEKKMIKTLEEEFTKEHGYTFLLESQFKSDLRSALFDIVTGVI